MSTVTQQEKAKLVVVQVRMTEEACRRLKVAAALRPGRSSQGALLSELVEKHLPAIETGVPAAATEAA